MKLANSLKFLGCLGVVLAVLIIGYATYAIIAFSSRTPTAPRPFSDLSDPFYQDEFVEEAVVSYFRFDRGTTA